MRATLSLVGHTAGVYSVAWSPNGTSLVSGSMDKTIKLWKVDGTLLQTLTGHTDTVYSVAWSPNGTTLASSSGRSDKTVKLWKADANKKNKK